KMAHDQQEFGALEELFYKREQAIQALTCELWTHRMMASLSRNASVNDGSQFDFPTYDYPPLKCNVNEVDGPGGDFEDVEKYAFGETPRSQDRLRNLDHRISDMEKSPTSPSNGDMTTSKRILEKVIIGQSPRRSKHSRKISTDSSGSLLSQAREIYAYLTTDTPRLGTCFKNTECISQVENFSNRNVDETSDIRDDTTDRICIIDSIYHGAPHNSFIENKAGIGKLYMRLQALEADRESTKQAIISMRTDKAQLVLLREIAQQLCKEITTEKRAPVKKQLNRITSFILWRKKARQSKYMFGKSSSNVGLLMLLDKGTRTMLIL
uniref:Uncharacterized protein n=1 Tax=Kalanchoe fedtschenkoi TaxID=63787 RepID=A0A7N0VKL6_KALFE